MDGKAGEGRWIYHMFMIRAMNNMPISDSKPSVIIVKNRHCAALAFGCGLDHGQIINLLFVRAI